MQEPAITSRELTKTQKLDIFERIPISSYDCSKHLRLAAVQNIINNVIKKYLWRPFFSAYLLSQNKDQEFIPKMSECLRDRGEPETHNWNMSTMRILDRLDEAVKMKDTVGDLIDSHIIRLLKPLLADEQAENLRRELTDVFIRAVELGKKSQRDNFPTQIRMNPDIDRKDWVEYAINGYEKRDIPNLPSDSTIEPFHQRLVVSPLITRPSSVNTMDGKMKDEVIYPGVALFSDTNIFHDGAAEWKFINDAGKEASMHANGGRASSVLSSPLSPYTTRRHGSVSTSVPALQAPSKTWGSGTGTGLGIATERTDMYG